MALLPTTKYIGEVGLDFSEGAPDRETQVSNLKTILKQADEYGNKCISLHSRRAGAELINICSRPFDGVLICHWYSGPVSELKNLPDHLYFSINTAMLKSRSGKDIISALPMNRVLLESDGPYIKTGGVSASPLHLKVIVEALAHRWKMSIEEALNQVTENAKSIMEPTTNQSVS
jgi:TatD DNase family protein